MVVRTRFSPPARCIPQMQLFNANKNFFEWCDVFTVNIYFSSQFFLHYNHVWCLLLLGSLLKGIFKNKQKKQENSVVYIIGKLSNQSPPVPHPSLILLTGCHMNSGMSYPSYLFNHKYYQSVMGYFLLCHGTLPKWGIRLSAQVNLILLLYIMLVTLLSVDDWTTRYWLLNETQNLWLNSGQCCWG